MSLGTPPWYAAADKSAFSSSSTVEEPRSGADLRAVHRAHQQRSSPRPDSREIAKWFGESAADKSDVGRSYNGVCFRSTAAKSESEVRHESRHNTFQTNLLSARAHGAASLSNTVTTRFRDASRTMVDSAAADTSSSTCFEENSLKHRCCCRCCHVRVGAMAIGVLEMLYMVFQLVNSFVLFLRAGEGHTLSFIVTVIGIALGIAAIVLLFVGIVTVKPFLLIPHLLMQALATLVLFALMLLCAVSLLTGSSVVLRIINATDDPQERPLSALGTYSPLPDVYFVSHALTLIVVIALLIFLFATAVQIWLLFVVVRCYGYLRSRSDFEKTTESVFVTHLNGLGIRPAKTSETDF